jgi:DNA-binding response OmpR family regulator
VPRLHPAEREAAAPVGPRADHGRHSPYTERLVRILILEDDPIIALDLQMILESAGHEVVEVCDKLAKIRSNLGLVFDFALLDVDLPDGKSYGVASLLDVRKIPFAFVSASRESERPANLRHAPFIAKPYHKAAIVNSVRRH